MKELMKIVSLEPHEFRSMTVPFLLVLILGIGFSLISCKMMNEDQLLGGDSKQYVRIAGNLVNNHVLSLEDHGPDKPFYPTMARMPGYPAVLGLISIVFGNSVWNPVIYNLICFLLSVLIITRIAYSLLGLYPAFITGLLCVTHYQGYFQSMNALSDISTNFIIIAMFYIYQKYRSVHATSSLVVIGLASGFLSLYREPVFTLLAIGFLIFGLDYNIGWQLTGKKLVLVLSCMAIAYSPWIYRNYYLSHKFIPITIYGKGAGVDIKKRQAKGEMDIVMSLEFWKSIVDSEYLVLKYIAEKLDYNYSILYSFDNYNLHNIQKNRKAIDPAKYFPEQLFESLKNDSTIAPTIKTELLYLELCRNYRKSIIVPFSLSRFIRLSAIKFLYLYSANDISPYDTWKYGYYTHRCVQFRWYFLECPLAVVGVVCSLRSTRLRPYIIFIGTYTLLIATSMHIEPRYGLLPIMYIKIFTGYGIYLLCQYVHIISVNDCVELKKQ